jgi:ankyrin repeat protein
MPIRNQYRIFIDAIKAHNLHLVEHLINTIDINTQDEYGNTPLHIATLVDDFDIVKILVEHGADINSENIHGDTPYFLAGTNDIIRQYLREHGAYPFSQPYGNNSNRGTNNTSMNTNINTINTNPKNVNILNINKNMTNNNPSKIDNIKRRTTRRLKNSQKIRKTRRHRNNQSASNKSKSYPISSHR